jgi:hypothetical protein
MRFSSLSVKFLCYKNKKGYSPALKLEIGKSILLKLNFRRIFPFQSGRRSGFPNLHPIGHSTMKRKPSSF